VKLHPLSKQIEQLFHLTWYSV